MIERVIRASVENRVLVLFGALLLAIAGIVAVLKTPVDALPDLSDVQVIIKTDYSGQAPEIVENEVTICKNKLAAINQLLKLAV